ncbi:four helix bundle protein [Rudanella lutea]|uniref:four helix bundle protein n=1 Tax=Rudanella lutea TaxID=451374 RepID=UPI00036CDB5A|nr:four helix bundle protein [Rudanella lutea]
MATIRRFEDLTAWQKARWFSKAVYAVTRNRTFLDDPDLKRQIRRASGSVMDNISEGFGRGGRVEFVQFLGIAKGSLDESKSQLYRAHDNDYIDQTTFDDLYAQADEAGRVIDGLMSYLKESDVKGRKFQRDSASQPEELKTVNRKL